MRNINRKELPVYYYWNSSAWMQSGIFTHWLKKLNQDLQKAWCKILLLLDNATVHLLDEGISFQILSQVKHIDSAIGFQQLESDRNWNFDLIVITIIISITSPDNTLSTPTIFSSFLRLLLFHLVIRRPMPSITNGKHQRPSLATSICLTLTTDYQLPKLSNKP